MGKSYLGCKENISTGQIILFCSYRDMFSYLPCEVSCCDVDFVKCKQNVFRESCVHMRQKSVSKRNLSTWENFCQGKITLVNLSKFFSR